MSERVRTVLRPEPQSLWAHLGCSLVFHLTAGLTVVCMGGVVMPCNPRPVIDPDEAIEVSMVVLPKSRTKMPDRAAQAPRDAGEIIPEAPPPAPEPIKKSDLVVHKEDAKPDQGNTRDDSRAKLLEELKRQELLENLLAPQGKVDRNASDPNSESDVAINAMGVGSRADPEYAAYAQKVQQLFMKNFHPLRAVVDANPGLVCTVFVTVDPTNGRVTGYSVKKSSGVAAFDAAAERAAQAVATIPLPPARFQHLVAEGYEVRFRPP